MNLVNFEAEQTVLGTCIQDNSATGKISYLKAEDFYNHKHREMYKVITQLYNSGTFFDMMAVDEKLPDDVADFAYVAEVAKAGLSGSAIVGYADRVKDMANRRAVHTILSETLESLGDRRNGSIDIVSGLSDSLNKSVLCQQQTYIKASDELIEDTMQEMQKSIEGIRVGMGTGIEEIDQRLGYKKMAFGEVTVLGGLSKNGKTLTANTIIARAEYLPDETCHVISIEMSEVSMFNGIVSAMSGVPSNFYARQDHYHKHAPGQYDQWMQRWGAAAQELKENNRVTIDGRKDVDVEYICSSIRRQFSLARNEGKRLRLVVIDHLHQMDYPGQASTTEKMGEAARKIKALAAELDIAVLALAQLNNKYEGMDPTSYHILDTSRWRHNMQAFIGTRIFRQNGGTFFGIYGDAQRFGDQDTLHTPAYMKLLGGVLKSLGEGEYFSPKSDD